MKELLDILKSVPFGNIVGSVFSGQVGWKTPVAFVLQVAFQIFILAGLVGLPLVGVILTAPFLVVLHLGTGFLCIMVAAGDTFSPSGKTLFTTPAGYIGFAITMATGITTAGGIVILGLACALAGTSFTLFLKALCLSVLGGLVLHLMGAILPTYKLFRQP